MIGARSLRSWLEYVAETAIDAMLRSLEPGAVAPRAQPYMLPFELFTPENI